MYNPAGPAGAVGARGLADLYLVMHLVVRRLDGLVAALAAFPTFWMLVWRLVARGRQAVTARAFRPSACHWRVASAKWVLARQFSLATRQWHPGTARSPDSPRPDSADLCRFVSF